MIKSKYEISLWEDKLVSDHYKEQKICIIGADDMTSQARAVEPKLVQNVNGTNTLTFKLFYYYIDNETGEKVRNPFLSLLVNERKVKCKWEDKWYDFIIKGIQEDSNGKSITYTCSDLFVNELSKTGFSLEFDTELNNNQGTAQELAEKVLEGTDWKLDTENSDHILQTIEEPLYKTTVKDDIKTLENTIISTGSEIYLFYSVVSEKETYIQFIYNKNGYETETNSQILKENNCFSIEVTNYENWIQEYTTGVGTSLSDYRGKRLVRQQLQEFNEAVGRNCYVFDKAEDDKTKVLGYSTVEYKDPTVVLNLISNSKDFVDINGWQGESLGWQLYPLFYDSQNIPENYSAKTYLLTSGERDEDNKLIPILNTGLQNSSSYLEEGLQRGQKYIIRIKAFSDNSGAPSSDLIAQDEIDFKILDYFNSVSTVNGVPAHNSGSYCSNPIFSQKPTYFRTKDTDPQENKTYYYWGEKQKEKEDEEDKWDYIEEKSKSFSDGVSYYEKGEDVIEAEVEIVKSIPRADITTGYSAKYNDEENNRIAKLGLFITLPKCWIEEIQFYQKVESYNGQVIHIGDLDTQSVGTTYYKYFEPNSSYKKEEDIKYLYSGTQKQGYIKRYEDEETEENKETRKVLYEKIRSITEKQSNRFNILQSIAETFECWIRFEIQHKQETGEIDYNDDGTPKKTVYLREKIGNELGYGFSYGIDLKTISRSIDSNQITTKVIVSPNINEYAEEGMCEIAQSQYSETGENYIYDFGYYISQGLLNSGELNKYLYLPNGEESGYYIQLKKLNTEYNARAREITAKKTELTKQNSLKTVYDQYVSSAREEGTNLRSQLAQLAGLNTYNSQKVLQYISTHQDDVKTKNLLTTLTTTEHNLEQYQDSLSLIEKSVSNLASFISMEEKKNDEILVKKKKLDEDFYKRFSRFIQEGSWTSQDYLDENLYYLDAKSVAYTSSRPKVSYNISVVRLNALPDFKGKKFDVGDVSYIEDTEFFGYVRGANGWKTPYREQILISEKTSNFDSPEKDTFTVQNYKTQFEDLFQRITATTQSLQYSTGEYNRASSIVEGKGVINSETLQNSININNELVFKSQNEAIFQDSTGLTLSDTTDPSKKTKLTSGGLFISVDGGVTWKNAVRGEGIATQYLTAGAINIENIAILDGASPTFRWDKYGINAFNATRDKDNKLIGIDTSTFVRFDKYGIYGCNKGDTNFVPESENSIWNIASFGMTWKGFFLKNKKENSQIEVSTENDILITQKVTRYILTEDTSPKENKKYYELKDSDYVEVKDILSSINPSESIYYEQVEETVERIKLGRLDNKYYGLRLKDDDNSVSLETDSSGNLWLKDKLTIQTDKKYLVRLGHLTNQQVINANDNFIVYEDGSILAKNGTFSGDITGSTGTFTGEIRASSGRIGGLEINGAIDKEPFATITDKSLTIKNGGLSIIKASYDETQDNKQKLGKTYYLKEENGEYKVQEVLGFEEGKTYYELSEEGIYKQTEDNTPFSNKNYYLKDSDGNYQEASINFEEGKTYYEKNETQAFGADDKGDLIFSGNLVGATGTFSGELKGANGSFSGEIIASKGTIGGFTIAEDRLYSSDSTSPSITLYGKDGKIIANNIELGVGAKIEDKIILSSGDGKSEAYIYNPEKHDDVFLKAGNLELTTNGLLQTGSIVMDGSENGPEIRSTKWSITPETATFKNVIAEGGTIENVVFKNSTVQSAGGIMIFKPSWNGTLSKDEENYYITLEDALQQTDTETQYDLAVNDRILIQKEEADVLEVSSDNGKLKAKISFVEEKVDINLGDTLTVTKLYSCKINNEEKEISDALLFGVNSSDADQFHLLKRGLTISAPTVVEKEVKYPDQPNLFIGDLSALGGNYSGYGLVGDNVYLNGTLTTKVKNSGDKTYAGINTLSEVEATVFADSKIKDRVVFWAGASSSIPRDIQASPFQVTDKGRLYASQGVFSDSVFTESSFYGGDIYTARIHGWKKGEGGKDESSALSIFNSNKGISFIEGDDSLSSEKGEKITLQINQNNLKFREEEFIKLEEDNGKSIVSFKTTGESGGYLQLSGYTLRRKISTADTSKNGFGFSFGENGIFGISNNEEIFSITSQATKAYKNFEVSENVKYSNILEYRKVDKGYDLYVSE